MNGDRLKATEDPWAARTAHFSDIVARQLAEMFLDGKSIEVRNWARCIARELSDAGFDIDDDIVASLRALTLGLRPPPDECPF